MNAKEHLESEEKDLIKAIGSTMWESDKVYFVYEVIEFMESYYQEKSLEGIKCRICGGELYDICGDCVEKEMNEAIRNITLGKRGDR